MSRFYIFSLALVWAGATADLDTAAITVYRNPEFFRHLSAEFNNHLQKFTTDTPVPSDEYESPADDSNYFQQYNTEFNPDYSRTDSNEDIEDSPNHSNHDAYEEAEEEGGEEREADYQYPGEPKKPNPPVRPDVNIHYDPSPDFNAPPRDIEPSPKKPKGRGPYGHPRHTNHNYEALNDPEEYIGYETIRETKKGTREFLKHNTLPANHELEDLRSMRRQPVRASCGTRIKAKKPGRTFIAYKFQPLYRVVPFNRNRLVYFVKPNALMKRRHAPKSTPDDSAYVINSAFDGDYQRILKPNF